MRGGADEDATLLVAFSEEEGVGPSHWTLIPRPHGRSIAHDETCYFVSLRRSSSLTSRKENERAAWCSHASSRITSHKAVDKEGN